MINVMIALARRWGMVFGYWAVFYSLELEVY